MQAAIIIGIILVIGVFFLLGVLLDKGLEYSRLLFGDFSKAIGSAFESIIGLLGRTSPVAKVVIPGEIDAHKYSHSTQDVERIALLAYEPKLEPRPDTRAVNFNPITPKICSENSQAKTTVNIAEIDRITTDIEVPFNEVISEKISSLDQYPVNLPVPFLPPAQPPTWVNWTKYWSDLPQPTFEPPYHTGLRTILNVFVFLAYQTEFSKLEEAKAQRSRYLMIASERDHQMESLARIKREHWENAFKSQRLEFNKAIKKYEQDKGNYDVAAHNEKQILTQWHRSCAATDGAGLEARVKLSMLSVEFPPWVWRESQSKFDSASGVFVHDQRFPDLASLDWGKIVDLKAGSVRRPLNQKERRESAAKIYPALSLRIAFEIARLDRDNLVKGIAVNGWAEFTSKTTGKKVRDYCSSLFVTKAQILNIDIRTVDVIAAFNALKGIRSPGLEVVPVAPTIRLNTDDPRFVASKAVLGAMSQGQNIAAMDWEDFEHLCRELFEKAFAANGAEVRVTQASRDQGVDAVVFDPDPLRGGKIVIQAKRYTNIVDVSAVRELFGTVHNEGALKGILVTTSYYGHDSYEFIKDKPLTLINGPELLALLHKYGYNFKIDLLEAKKLLSAQN